MSALVLHTTGTHLKLHLHFLHLFPSLFSEPGDNLILPCKDPDQGLIIVVEWKRTDLESEYVLRYRDKQINPENQHPSYKNRADLLIGQMKVGDASLILRNAATDDSGTYECRIVQTGKMHRRSLVLSIILMYWLLKAD
uniref:Ig-like domain-containing protein n=1 Tax=Poecilia reticulata TaxID=8081 RepID=A0A3P9NMK0_POERE